MRRFLIGFTSACLCLAPSVCRAQAKPAVTPRLNSPEYAQVQQRLSRGWNTWDVHSVTTHVLLPEGLSVRIGVQKKTRIGGDSFLPVALIGRMEADAEQVFPGPHAFDGSYTDLRLTWQGLSMRIQSATDAGDLVLLVTPLQGKGDTANARPATLVFSVGYLWNRAGTVERTADHIEAHSANKTIPFFVEGQQATALNAPVAGSYIAVDLEGSRAFSSGKRRTVPEVQAILDRQRATYEQSNAKAGASASIADAIQTVLAWDTIYDPENQRVISPVSRVWSVGWGGYVLFDWDTFFAASMASIGNRDLAYADAIETLNEVTAEGFVPNFGRGGGWKSDDRSEPPVGAITVLGLYQKFKDKWVLRDSFDRLLAWNRWWSEHRDVDGYLVWGSDTHDSPDCHDDASCGTLQGARYESGLDNSPMYDDAPFDKKTGRMMVADVGLMGMYVADCDALSTIAEELGKAAEAMELSDRAQHYREKLATLWDEKSGIFLNKDLISGKLSPRLSPTNFYPMMGRAATATQADRMVREHLLNLKEFGGEYVLPSIARNDAAYKDQDYWRGRVWGPMNYLVYLGLRNYNQPEARQELASKSLKLFLKEWKQNGHVHENYNATLGSGDDVKSSDRFYHWGALLGYITYLEQANPIAAQP